MTPLTSIQKIVRFNQRIADSAGITAWASVQTASDVRPILNQIERDPYAFDAYEFELSAIYSAAIEIIEVERLEKYAAELHQWLTTNTSPEDYAYAVIKGRKIETRDSLRAEASYRIMQDAHAAEMEFPELVSRFTDWKSQTESQVAAIVANHA